MSDADEVRVEPVLKEKEQREKKDRQSLLERQFVMKVKGDYTLYYDKNKPDKVAIREYKDCIVGVDKDNNVAIKAIVERIQEKGWTSIKISGNKALQVALAAEAMEKGIIVEGYEKPKKPQPEKEVPEKEAEQVKEPESDNKAATLTHEEIEESHLEEMADREANPEMYDMSNEEKAAFYGWPAEKHLDYSPSHGPEPFPEYFELYYGESVTDHQKAYRKRWNIERENGWPDRGKEKPKKPQPEKEVPESTEKETPEQEEETSYPGHPDHPDFDLTAGPGYEDGDFERFYGPVTNGFEELGKELWEKEREKLRVSNEAASTREERLAVVARRINNPSLEEKGEREHAYNTLSRSDAIQQFPELKPIYEIVSHGRESMEEKRDRFTDKTAQAFIQGMRNDCFDRLNRGEDLQAKLDKVREQRSIERETPEMGLEA